MKYKHAFKSAIAHFLLLPVLLLFSAQAAAQGLAINFLTPPQPLSFRIENLTQFSVTHDGDGPLEVVAEGMVSEARIGLLASVTSEPFTLFPGVNVFTAGNAPGIDDHYISPDYLNIEFTGVLPEGHFTACLRLRDADDNSPLAEACQDFQNRMPQLTLVTPPGGAEIPPETPLLLQWALDSPLPGLEYSLKIFEVQPGQTANDARNNIVHFEEDDLSTTVLQYPAAGQDFQPGTPYVWVVTGIIEGYPVVESELGWFTAGGGLALSAEEDINEVSNKDNAAADGCAECTSNILQNGSFTEGVDAGKSPIWRRADKWIQARTVQILEGTGCDGQPDFFFRLFGSGQPPIGENLWQAGKDTYLFKRDKTYKVSLSVRWHDVYDAGKNPEFPNYVQFRIRAYHPGNEVLKDIGISQKITDKEKWVRVDLPDWQADIDYERVVIDVVNEYNGREACGTLSWGDIDKICIKIADQ